MQTQYSKDGIQHFMIVGWEHEWVDVYDHNLLRYQNVPYLMSYEVREINGEIALYYKLDYRITLETVVGQMTFNIEMLKNMITSISEVINVCEEYLLDPNHIVYEIDKIFIDITTGKLKFLYYPGLMNERHDLKDLISQMFQYIDRKNDDCMVYLMKFYDKVTKPDNADHFTREFKVETMDNNNCNDKGEICDKISEETSVNPKSTHMFAKINIGNIIKLLMLITAAFDITLLAGLIFDVLTYEKMGYLFVGMAILIGLTIIHIAFGEEDTPEEIMDDYYNNIEQETSHFYVDEEQIDTTGGGFGETVLLTSGEEGNNNVIMEVFHGELYLEAMIKDMFPSIHVSTGNIVIGCYKEICDYVLAERGVSRFHAKLMKKEDGLYILDLNSTNGTFINGKPIDAGKEYRLEVGDMVSFAGNAFFVAEDTSRLTDRKAG